MKIECIGEQKFLIFINSFYLPNISSDKQEIIELVKSLLLKLRCRLFLQGFYKVKVYLHGNVGVFLELVQLERMGYDADLDFRILVYLDENIYFKTKDYFILPQTDIYYLDEYYYCDVSSFSKILNVVEFGDFVYGRELYSIMCRWKKC